MRAECPLLTETFGRTQREEEEEANQGSGPSGGGGRPGGEHKQGAGDETKQGNFNALKGIR